MLLRLARSAWYALNGDRGALPLGAGIIAGSTLLVAGGLAAVVTQAGISSSEQLSASVTHALNIAGGAYSFQE